MIKRLKYLTLAALVAFAACDEGEEVVTPPTPVTGTITGAVTIDGAGAQGVTVTLGNGQTTTTSASGQYQFDNVEAGAYQVTISGFPADATFPSTSAAATIQSAGEVKTVNFNGSFIKTASIFGSVTASGQALSGVTVTVVGTSCNTTTDAGGQFNCGGLRAGTYTVQIAGFDNSQYSFASTSQQVTVSVGEAKVIAFTGQRRATAQITGAVSIDGTAAAGIDVTLSTGAATETDAQGRYTFANLLPGTYTVTISDLPADASFPSTTASVTVAQSGQVVTQDFVGAFQGSASIFGQVSIQGTGLAGVTVTMAGPSTATVTTDASGKYSATNLRAGTYTVTISGYDTDQYSFTATSQTVTLAVGQSAAADFSGVVRSTSSINGVVTIDGAAAAGLTVSLGSGTAQQTDANGRYSFANLGTGTYSVVVSGQPSDVTFGTNPQSVQITAAGQTLTANFTGVYVRTSSITGTVRSGSTGIAGVTVTATGPQTLTATTDANGQYDFNGIRAGTYNVAISGFDAARYNFTTTTQSVTVTMGATANASFNGPVFQTSSITGRLYIDENDKNNTYDGPTLEPNLMAGGVTLTLIGGDVATTRTVTTAADGTFAIADLAPGNYNLTINTGTGIPAAYVFGGTSTTAEIRGLTVGGTMTANFPFDIRTQSVTVQAFLGRDENASGLPTSVPVRATPLPGVSFNVYNTYANAVAAGACTLANGCLGTGVTGATGEATISFLRSSDSSPQNVPDNIVFAARTGIPAEHIANGEAILEIQYDAVSASFTAPDAFDALNTRINFSAIAQEIDGDPLNNWNMSVFLNDTTNTAVRTSNTSANGSVAFTDATTTLPATYFVRLNRTAASQPSSGHGFVQTPVANQGTVAGDYLRVVHNGVRIATDTVRLGTENVRYTDASVYLAAHHEADDVMGYTAGDNLVNVDNITAGIYQGSALRFNLGAASTTTGRFPVVQPAISAGGSTYTVRARSTVGNQLVLNDTIQDFTLDGSDSSFTLYPLAAGTGGSLRNSTFAYKYTNGTVLGNVRTEIALANANGVIVTLMPAPNNIQPGFTSRTDTVAAGAYSFLNVREGPYYVTVADLAGTYQFRKNVYMTPETANVAADTIDVEGNSDNDIANFSPRFLNTTVRGVVVNDRDQDASVLDPNEALSGVSLDLIEDLDQDFTLDANETTVVQTTVSGADGSYTFANVPAGFYIVRAPSGVVGGARVLSGLATDGSAVRTQNVTTTAAATTRGTTTSFPRWNYTASTIANPQVLPTLNIPASPNGLRAARSVVGQVPDFTFLFGNTTITGSATTGGGAAVSGMTVTIRRCQTSPGTGAVTSPPSAGTCATYVTGVSQNVVTDASGNFSVTGLEEGVYEVTPSPVTAGFTGSTPANRLYLLVGANDIETGTFVIN